MEKSSLILLLRYSDYHGIDTIKEHSSVIKKYGSCWWAKIGKQPAMNYLAILKKQGVRNVLLYTPGEVYRAELQSISRERPKNNYPIYYEKYVFNTELEPSLYFEFVAIEKEELSVLNEYIVCSSGKEVLYDLENTICSYMLIQHKSVTIQLEMKPKKSKNEIHKEIRKENKYDCIYKVNGKCTRKTCVNYNYECLRPQYCLKQKAK